MMINLRSRQKLDPKVVRMRCACGVEYGPVESKSCPKCGRKDPHEIASDGVTWRPFKDFMVDGLRLFLDPGGLDEVPEAQREGVRKEIEAQIAALQSGGPKA